ncbi:kunitz trypsin inhibitor 5-like [Macadamia integrifolia]|uniref:kunitz trypsin inhibitor 5-like n=1 Tax=Macadamia integrifolia TaxID=60698 RepID=UPI001C5003DB|nr:kunitz trypsin inhibitor 5-like [Macadamia integrifolia]
MKIQSILVQLLMIIAFLLQLEAMAQPHNLCEAVLDTDGNELQPGIPYYIVSAIRGGHGGGLSIGIRARSSSRTPIVKQHSHGMNFGSPVIFSPSPYPSGKPAGIQSLREVPSTPSSSQEMTIHESTNLNIKFMEMPGVWQVNESGRDRYVTLEGKPGQPGESTVKNWFKFQRFDESSPTYRIRYCPGVCHSCHVTCGDIGITKEHGTRWLSVSKRGEFPFVFIKASNYNEAN